MPINFDPPLPTRQKMKKKAGGAGSDRPPKGIIGTTPKKVKKKMEKWLKRV